ncbi:MAG: hypothetical protein HPY74_13965 [Firmicutes bacterium]|nr:hypothetical protein [Bacillota bacterium]
MISVISHNCNGFINQNMHDSRTKMLMPLALLVNDDMLKKYGLLSEEELKYIIDFIDTYGGFRVYN